MSQTSDQSSAIVSYAVPTLSLISPTTIPTVGSTFVLTGSNLGASSSSLAVNVVGASVFSNFVVGWP